MCSQDSLTGTVCRQRDGYVCVREFILYNTLIAAQVALPMLGGFLVNHNTPFYPLQMQQMTQLLLLHESVKVLENKEHFEIDGRLFLILFKGINIQVEWIIIAWCLCLV